MVVEVSRDYETKSMSLNDGYPVLFSADKIKSFVILFCESKNEVHVLKVTVRDLENENAKNSVRQHLDILAEQFWGD